ncbi:MAG TPA: PAS domain S-box protein [Flavisolibacter sp.]|jgi:PAS domain S-box-containing protein|nr:PAS domain S-box protein [Flavisolibacter sp.]
MKIQSGTPGSEPGSSTLPSGLNFEKLLSSLVDIICVCDGEGIFHYISSSAEQMLGYTPEEMTGHSFLDFIYPPDAPKTAQVLKEKKSNCQVSNFENRYRKKDGTVVPLLWSWRWDEDDQLFYCVVRDASDKYNAEQRLMKAQEMARVANYEFNVVTNQYTYVSDTIFEIFGVNRKTFPEYTSELFWSLVHPDDIPIVKKALTAPDHLFSTTLTFRIVRPDGIVAYIKRNREAIYDNDGRLIKTIGTIQDISDLVRSEQALRESEERFRFLVQHGNEMIAILDKEGFYTFVSNNVNQVVGYEAEELVGQNALQLIHPDDLPAMYAHLQHIQFCEIITTGAFRFLAKDGEWRWVESTVSNHLHNPIIGGLLINTRDITEKKRKEEALQFSEQRLDALVQNGSDLIVIIDEKGGFRYSTNNIASILGYAPDELKDKNAFEFIHPDDLKKVADEIAKVVRNEEANGVTHRFLHKNGEWIWLESKGTNHLDNSAIGGILVNARNINDRVKLQKRLNRELINKQREITSAVIRAQESERSQLGLELHDNVNQILTTVKLYNEMYLTGYMQDKELLAKATQYTQECINEIRSISKRLSAPTLGKISLEDSVRELVDSINLTGRLEIIYVPKGFAGCTVAEDIHLAVYRIVQESLNNVIKYSEAQLVCIELGRTDDNISLKITDNGKGFDTSARRVGIGITNMRTRAENLNGTFSIKSEPGKGCEIEILFPCHPCIRHEQCNVY